MTVDAQENAADMLVSLPLALDTVVMVTGFGPPAKATKMANESRVYPRADIVVLTVLPEEFDAVRRCLGNPVQLPGSEEQPNTHAWHEGTLHSSLYDSSFTVVFGKGSPTNNYAVAATLTAVQYFSPRYVVFVGVGGGLKRASGQRHGDVVISTYVCAYEYGKIDSAPEPEKGKERGSGFRPRVDLTIQADLGLSRAADAVIARKDKWWLDADNLTRQPVAQTGHVGSGDKVIDDPSDAFFAEVLKQWPKLLAVEMEGAGVGVAIQEAHAAGKNVGFALIRGLSDLPHAKSSAEGASTEERDSNKPLASFNAASFFAHLVKTSWPTPPRSKTLDDDQKADTQRLRGLIGASLGQVSNALGARIKIPRPDAVSSVEAALASSSNGLALVGPSGTGKSALLRGLVEARIADDTEALWFDAAGFRDGDYLKLEGVLGLRRSLREFAHRTVSPLPVLVIDGLDREFDEKVFRITAALLGTLSQKWKTAVACQSEQWERVQLALLKAGVAADKWRVLQPDVLDDDEYQSVAREVPKIASLLADPRLRAILSNLKILDLIVAKLLVGENVPSAGWVGESSVALWYWQSYVQTGPRATLRGHIAARIAERQVNDASADSAFGADDLRAVDELVLDKVLRRSPEGGLVFEHDLIGDWIRFQALVSSGSDFVRFVSSRISLPLWPRAIRLYGLYLLEHRHSVEEWDGTRSAISKAHGESAGDLILESVAFATRANTLLGLIEPVLLRDTGALLRRFLNRFLLFCTVADPEMIAFARVANIERDDVEPTYRFPNWRYWPAVMQFICDEQAKLLSLAPTELSRVAELWLKFAPAMPLRTRVAELGIALGGFGLGLEGSYKEEHEKQRRACYRVALRAAIDVPELSIAFARRAAHRIAPSDKAMVDQRSEIDDGELVRFPDGPSSRIDDEFRKIVLDDPAFQPFIDAAPAAAREVALAVLLREPHYRERFDPIEHEYALTEPRWKTFTFLDGPFLLLLKRDFGEGLELIARLVDGSTTRLREYEEQRFQLRGWYGAPARDDDPKPDETWNSDLISLDLGGIRRKYAGGSSVYAWAGGHHHVHNVVQTALTALEKHLYLRSDAGRLDDRVLAQVLERVESVAFLMVLINVGKFRVELFDGILRPLLGDMRLYEWDVPVTSRGFRELLMFNWNWSESTRKLVAQFVEMPHRSQDLRLVARQRFELVPETRDYLRGRFAIWRDELAKERHELDWVESTIAAIGSDSTHFVAIPTENGGLRLISNAARVEPDPAAVSDAQERLEALMFPIRARRMLDGEVTERIAEDALWALIESRSNGWKPQSRVGRLRAAARRLWSGIRAWVGVPAQDEENAIPIPDERANVIVPAIALLAEFHSAWLHKDPERVEWCRAFLRGCADLPSDEDFNPGGAELEKWDEFAVEAAASLWSQAPEDKGMRDLVGRLALRPRYVVTRRLVSACAKWRQHSRRDFEQLVRVLVVVAQVRILMRMVLHIAEMPVKDPKFDTSVFVEDLTTWLERVRSQFVRGAIETGLVPWAELDPAQHIVSFKEWRERLRRRRPGVDLDLLQACHAWLPSFDRALDAEERAYIKWFWREALQAMASRRYELEDDDSPVPFESEFWLAGSIGILITRLDVNDARPYWEAILGMKETHAYLAERFLSKMFRSVLSMESVPPTFQALLASVVDGALKADGTESVPWSSFESAWLALVGLDEVTRGLWTQQHADLLTMVAPHLVRWLKRRRIHSRHMGTIARFLTSPGRAIRAAVLPALSERVSSDRELLEEEATADALAGLLQAMARDLSGDEARKDASFQRLLRTLSDEQNAVALTLYGKLAN